MNDDTISLLKECNAGCKMATNSMEQVIPYVRDEKMKTVINSYNERHIETGDECHELLNEAGKAEKDPPAMASAFSWVTTEMKLLIKDDTHQIASLLIDGCNMGVKSLAEDLNQYRQADIASIGMVRKLIKLEQSFSKELLEFV